MLLQVPEKVCLLTNNHSFGVSFTRALILSFDTHVFSKQNGRCQESSFNKNLLLTEGDYSFRPYWAKISRLNAVDVDKLFVYVM